MKQAELMKLALVVNDDDLDKATMEAGFINNGQLIYSCKDKSGDQRHSFYSKQSEEKIPDELKSIIVGSKRTREEAGSPDTVLAEAGKAIQLHHIRDYEVSSEIKGGSKGESADYLLYDAGNDACLQYIPVVTKFKLAKRRK